MSPESKRREEVTPVDRFIGGVALVPYHEILHRYDVRRKVRRVAARSTDRFATSTRRSGSADLISRSDWRAISPAPRMSAGADVAAR